MKSAPFSIVGNSDDENGMCNDDIDIIQTTSKLPIYIPS